MDEICKENYLYEQVKDYLIELIAQNHDKADFRLPTEESLRTRFGISRITVRRAYDELSAMGLLIRHKGKGTFVNPDCALPTELLKKRTTRHGKSGSLRVGVIVPILSSPHISAILDSAQVYCDEHGLDVVFEYYVTRQKIEEEIRAVKKCLSDGVDGMLIYPVDGELYNPELVQLSLQGFPIVLLDRMLPGLDLNFVTSDNRQACIDAIDLLVKNGHSKIAVFSGNPYKVSSITQRIDGYEVGLKRNNLLIDARLEIIANIDDLPFSEEILQQEYAGISQRLEELITDHSITAVVCVCNSSSIVYNRLINRIKKTDPNVKKRISVVFSDFSPTECEIITPHPVCITQNAAQIGEEAVKLLLEHIHAEQFVCRTVKIPCTIQPGKSVFPCVE